MKYIYRLLTSDYLYIALQSLREYYADLHEKGIESPNESEFQAYYILSHLWQNDIVTAAELLPQHVFSHHLVQLAIEFQQLAQPAFSGSRLKRNGGLQWYSRLFKLIQDDSTPYLFACLLHQEFITIRRHALKSMHSSYYNSQDHISVQFLVELLGFDDVDEAIINLEYYGIALDTEEDVLVARLGKQIDITGITKLDFLGIMYFNKFEVETYISIMLEDQNTSLIPQVSKRIVDSKSYNIPIRDILDGINRIPQLNLPSKLPLKNKSSFLSSTIKKETSYFALNTKLNTLNDISGPQALNNTPITQTYNTSFFSFLPPSHSNLENSHLINQSEPSMFSNIPSFEKHTPKHLNIQPTSTIFSAHNIVKSPVNVLPFPHIDSIEQSPFQSFPSKLPIQKFSLETKTSPIIPLVTSPVNQSSSFFQNPPNASGSQSSVSVDVSHLNSSVSKSFSSENIDLFIDFFVQSVVDFEFMDIANQVICEDSTCRHIANSLIFEVVDTDLYAVSQKLLFEIKLFENRAIEFYKLRLIKKYAYIWLQIAFDRAKKREDKLKYEQEKAVKFYLNVIGSHSSAILGPSEESSFAKVSNWSGVFHSGWGFHHMNNLDSHLAKESQRVLFYCI